uniref:Uncharacterized protein n=1 Tax=Vitis vinifera TaxID=29760 RepID=F6H9F5_VITVI
MNPLGTSSALQLTDSISYEEHLALLWLVLTRPGSELSTQRVIDQLEQFQIGTLERELASIQTIPLLFIM